MADLSTENYTMDEGMTVGCGCAACQQGEPNRVTMSQEEYQATQGEDSASQTSSNDATAEEFANYLTDGYWQDIGAVSRSWEQNTVSVSISNQFSADQKAGLMNAFDLWADVADIDFQLVTSGADITIVEGDDRRAFSRSSVYTTGEIASNTISIDTNVGGWRDLNDLGDYAFMTALHEIGHSLGLGHTGNYNGAANYNDDAQWSNDTQQMTVMSYFESRNVGSDHWNSGNSYQYSATPMLIDILAIQNIYGADYGTRNGDTVYGFNSTADRDVYDFSVSEVPLAIWDGGGIDTIDLSGYATDSTLYLTEGYFSSVGYMTNNLVIAYGATIENTIGGSGNDSLYGNIADNILKGGAGDDTLYGDEGNDTLDGEAGNDTVIYETDISDFMVEIVNSFTAVITDFAGDMFDYGQDTLINIENFIFGGTTYDWTQLQAFAVTPEMISARFNFEDVSYLYKSTRYGTETITAEQMGYDEASGDLLSVYRTAGVLTLTINDEAPQKLRIENSDDNREVIVNGSHSNLNITFVGSDNNDRFIVESGVTGNDFVRGYAGNDIIHAGLGSDKLYGNEGADEIHGGAGNDRISGGTDNDILHGDDGNDNISGDQGNDFIIGGAGRDNLHGGDDHDELHGGDGNDRLIGALGDDILNGDAGHDKLYGNDGDDIIHGGDGDDYASAGNGEDVIHGGIGNDRLSGGNNNDTLNGDEGDDRLYGDKGDDTLNGGDGNDLLVGGDDNDQLFGDAGDDKLYGSDGEDVIHGGAGNDLLSGDNQNDTLNGNAGIDRLYGGNGEDTLNGGADGDALVGGNGNDTLNGGDGNDVLQGGEGVDHLYGGDGSDRFYFRLFELGTGVDHLHDFNASEGDRIDLRDLLGAYDAQTDDINDFITLTETGGNTVLSADIDGGDVAETFQDILQIDGQTGLDLDTLIANNNLLS